MEKQAQKFRNNQRILVLPPNFFNKAPSSVKCIYTDSIKEKYECTDNDNPKPQEERN